MLRNKASSVESAVRSIRQILLIIMVASRTLWYAIMITIHGRRGMREDGFV